MKINKQVVSVSKEDFDNVMKVIKNDCEFLSKWGIMDYSLLLVKEKVLNKD